MRDPSIVRVGYIGLGEIGAPIARRLLDVGLDVSLWARRGVTLDPFRGGRARIVSQRREVAAGADVVGVCVGDDADVLDVLDEALLAALAPGSVLLIQSTVLPATCRRVAALVADSGVAVVDAPVSGGPDGAARGELGLAVGGRADAVARCRQVLDALGPWRHMGPVGSGQAAKLCGNAVYTATAAVALEALGAGRELGLDPAVLRAVLETTSARSFVVNRLPRVTAHGAVGHVVALLSKDVALFRRLCEGEGLDAAALLGTAERGLAQLIAWAGADWSDLTVPRSTPAPGSPPGPGRSLPTSR